MIKYLALILLTCPRVFAAELSVFDVLHNQEQERYNAPDTREFDVNEGEESTEGGLDVSSLHSPHSISTNSVISSQSGDFHHVAEIVALNKVTSKSKKLSISVGSSAYFGNIEISVKKCWSNGDAYKPLHYIWVEIVESKIDEDPQKIFAGWIISNNIGAVPIEHPVYNIIAVRCHDTK